LQKTVCNGEFGSSTDSKKEVIIFWTLVMVASFQEQGKLLSGANQLAFWFSLAS